MYPLLISLFINIILPYHQIHGLPQERLMKNNGRIVGGSPGNNTQIVSLRDTSGRHFCAGTIIDSRWILTAAHCADVTFALYIVAGSNSIRKGGVKYNIDKKIKHPNYDANNAVNDIALLRTKQPITFNSKVQLIQLANSPTDCVGKLQLFGWGKQGVSKPASNDLLTLVLNVISTQLCQDAIGNITSVDQTMICTLNVEGEGACNGDSGGPLTTLDQTKICGIVSKGIPCAVGKPDVFTAVPSFGHWIVTTMKANLKKY